MIFPTNPSRGKAILMALSLALLALYAPDAKAQLLGAELRNSFTTESGLGVELVAFYPCGFDQIPDFEYASVFESMARGAHTYVKLQEAERKEVANNVSAPCKAASACMIQVTYRGKAKMRMVPGGYDLTWRNCCLEEVVDNLEYKPEEGFVLTAHISEEAMKKGNHTPVFNRPIFVKACQGVESESLVMPVDSVDGDSLVIVFTPLMSDRSETEPVSHSMVGPENTLYIPLPPYKAKAYAETYFPQNPLGNKDMISIDNKARQLRLVAPTSGRYIINLSIDEYRDGQKIGSTQRLFFTEFN